MRSYLSCWNKTHALLGFRRKKRKAPKRRDYLQRRSLFEQLEERQMLSGDPVLDLSSEEYVVTAAINADPVAAIGLNLPEFVLIQPEIPADELVELPEEDQLAIEPVFAIETVQTLTGPKAILSFNPSRSGSPPSALQELRIELRQNDRVLETYDILIDLAEESFREQFLEDRVALIAAEIPDLTLEQDEHLFRKPRAEKELTRLRNFIGPLTIAEYERQVALGRQTLETGFASIVDATTEELSSWAKRQVERQDVLEDVLDREQFYASIEQEAKKLSVDRQTAATVAEQQSIADREKSLQGIALLLAKDLERDLKSSEPTVASSAQKLSLLTRIYG